MSKHTEGPWAIVTNSYGHPDHIIGENGPLSGVVCSFGVKVKRTCALPELKSNARLIAAAPELLGALEAALKLIELVMPIEGDVTRKARAAIAKATGEQK